jgi:spore coat protein U-like protein
MRIVRALSGWALALCAGPALAAYVCNASITPVTVVYDPVSAVQNVTSGSYTVSCTRLLSDANTMAWSLAVNNGQQAGGGFNRVEMPPNRRYNYDTYRFSPYTTANLWGATAAQRFSGTLNFGASTFASVTGPFDIVMPALQNAQPAGTYTDTVTATLRRGASVLGTTTFGVTVRTNNTCQISVPPGNVNLTYTSFQGSAAAASTTYGVRCTTSLPYTMALDATSGTLLGLSYTLGISPSTSGTGTGATQTYTINGSIAAGQSGTCATAICVGSQTRTLTLSW